MIGHPWIIRNDHGFKTGYALDEVKNWNGGLPLAIASPEEMPRDAKIIEIPIDAERNLVVLYLIPNSAVDAAIRTYGWNLYPISRQPS